MPRPQAQCDQVQQAFVQGRRTSRRPWAVVRPAHTSAGVPRCGSLLSLQGGTAACCPHERSTWSSLCREAPDQKQG